MGQTVTAEYDEPIFIDEHRDGRYEKIKEFQAVKDELLAIKKTQNDLADCVFKNLHYFTNPGEKRDIILILRAELTHDATLHDQRKRELFHKITYETQRLQIEIASLIGTEEHQGDLIEQLSHDLNDACHGHMAAMKILGNRYQINEQDTDMQKELLNFVSSIERAERTHRCLTSLLDIANDIQTTEERLESLLGDSLIPKPATDQPVQGIFSQVVVRLKQTLHSITDWHTSQRYRLYGFTPYAVNQNVTGPSLTKWTCISTPNCPVSTCS